MPGHSYLQVLVPTRLDSPCNDQIACRYDALFIPDLETEDEGKKKNRAFTACTDQSGRSVSQKFSL